MVRCLLQVVIQETKRTSQSIHTYMAVACWGHISCLLCVSAALFSSLEGFTVELDRVRNLPYCETETFEVRFDPQSANVLLGAVDVLLPIKVLHAPMPVPPFLGAHLGGGTAVGLVCALSWMLCSSLGSGRPHISHLSSCHGDFAVPQPLQGQAGVLQCAVWAMSGRNHPAPQSVPGPL